jgi:hypothetical protein
MGKTTVPNVLRKRLWWLRFLWFGSDRFESVKFAVDPFESPKLPVGNCFRHDIIAEEDVDAPCGVHTDFESFPEQDVAGKEIKVHSGYVKYLVKGNRDDVAALAFNDEMNTPGADSKELAFRSVDFDGLIELLVVGQDVCNTMGLGTYNTLAIQ